LQDEENSSPEPTRTIDIEEEYQTKIIKVKVAGKNFSFSLSVAKGNLD
jgi:hypothetical protein